MTRVLVIGYGNPLRSDDGLGWLAAQRLAEQSWNQPVSVIACQQLMPELVESIRANDFVIFIDAGVIGRPGQLSARLVCSGSSGVSVGTHGFDAAVLLALAQQLDGSHPLAVTVSLCSATFDLHEGLSDALAARLPALLNGVRGLIEHAGRLTQEKKTMHEYAIIESMVHQTLAGLNHAGIQPGEVKGVRFQRGSTFSEDALRQTFAALSKGTLLENAEVTIETVNLKFDCPCGHQQIISSDDLIGHLFVCPVCGVVHEIAEAHDLTLIEVSLEPTERFSRTHAVQVQP